MSAFGIGGWELVLVLLIMLIVAGPKRMINWAYYLGKFTARMRVLWDEMVDVLQAEIDEAGVDIKLPREAPTKENLGKWANDNLKPISDPINETLEEVKEDVKDLRAAGKLSPSVPHGKPKPQPNNSSSTPSSSTPEDKGTSTDSPSFGAWSGTQTNTLQGESNELGTD